MHSRIQVNCDHYGFSDYYHKDRWASLWHQLDECTRLRPKTVLEIGPGAGYLKQLLLLNGIVAHTVDVDLRLAPDIVADCELLPIADRSYDLVCAFQVLEHLPYEVSISAFREMSRVSGDYILLSLPNKQKRWTSIIHIPGLKKLYFSLTWPKWLSRRHFFDGQHYWELGDSDHPYARLVADLSVAGDASLIRSYRVAEHPYHHFLMFKKGGLNSEVQDPHSR